jgi:hypothetical protein
MRINEERLTTMEELTHRSCDTLLSAKVGTEIRRPLVVALLEATEFVCLGDKVFVLQVKEI